jgi:hypothetical protein
MKTIIKYILILFLIIFLSLLFFGCEQPDGLGDKGCQVGQLIGTTKYVLIRCATNAQYVAGDNVAAGGISLSAYEPGSIAFTPVVNCSQCPGLYPP